MTVRNLGVVGIKLVGLMAVVNALQTLPNVFGMMTLSQTLEENPVPLTFAEFLPAVFWVLVPAAIGISLLAYAEALGRRLFPDEGEIKTSFGTEELQIILFSTVGAYLLASTLPRLFVHFVGLMIAIQKGWDLGAGVLLGERWLDLLALGLQGALGLYLLFGGRSAVRWVQRLRRFGADKKRDAGR